MKRLIILIIIIIIVQSGYSQDRISFYLSAGSSTFKEIDNDAGSSYENFYTNALAFRTGIVYKLLKNSRLIYPTTGFLISSKGVTNNIPDSYGSSIASESWIERYVTTDGFLKLNYAFEPWLILNSGLSASIPLSHYKSWDKENIPFSYLSFVSGININIKKIVLIFDYSIGISPTMEFSWSEILFKERVWTIGVGYSF
ncbi:MAG TPA: hypothetical protein VMW76_04450 [Bacteroidales bacterium]|nr:hypothetical protein [Bacteroidales bacterium]